MQSLTIGTVMILGMIFIELLKLSIDTKQHCFLHIIERNLKTESKY